MGHTIFLHRWTWRFAVFNFVAANSAITEIVRDCGSTPLVIALVGHGGEGVWVVSYSASQFILLAVVYDKVKALAQPDHARWLRRVYCFMFVMLVSVFAPVLISDDYPTSIARMSFMVGFVSGYVFSSIVATHAMLQAARTADLLIAGQQPSNPQGLQSAFYMPAYWTRLSAYATFASMFFFTGVQVLLLIWTYYHFRAPVIRILADLFAAMDFVVNAFCAATLAGMIGPRAHRALATGALEQVGLLIDQDSTTASGSDAQTPD